MLVLLLLGAFAVAGCGDDDDGGSRTTAAAAGSDLGVLAARCGLSSGAASSPLIPEGLLPARSRVVSAEEDSAVAIVAAKIEQAYAEISGNAPGAGFTVREREFEGIEAEVFLDSADGPLTVELRQTPRCSDVTQVRVERD